jgi:hypothetical protein
MAGEKQAVFRFGLLKMSDQCTRKRKYLQPGAMQALD